MQNQNRPTQKLTLSCDMFNALYSTLDYFIGTEATVGVTEFSRSAAKFKEQLDRYGKFIINSNFENSTATIYLYERELLQLLKLLIMQNAMFANPTVDYFSEVVRQKSSRRGSGSPDTSEKRKQVLGRQS